MFPFFVVVAQHSHRLGNGWLFFFWVNALDVWQVRCCRVASCSIWCVDFLLLSAVLDYVYAFNLICLLFSSWRERVYSAAFS